ncbi:hypothetical protein BG841_15820 [Marinobacter sp. X15-166B]|nr:hypothetical protein BG841_15820 [Marinobacter sp. X15-166B]
MYHRISDNHIDEGLNAENFKRQIQLVKMNFNTISLSDLLSDRSSAQRYTNCAVITFDDGYQDFYKTAYPILRAEGVPVTIFVTTGFIDQEQWLWPDQIKYLLGNTDVKKFNLDALGELCMAEGRDRAWHKISDHCLTLPNKEKLKFIVNLAKKLDTPLPKTAPPEYEGLTWGHLREMKETGLDVQSHSYSHPIMSNLDDRELKFELEEPIKRIHEELGHKPNIFCYPNGQKIDFNDRVKAAIKMAGYEYAVAAFPGRHTLKDLYEIKRYPTSDNMEVFNKALFGLTRLAAR